MWSRMLVRKDTDMNAETIVTIETKMFPLLNEDQQQALREVLEECLGGGEVPDEDQFSLVKSFIAAKRVEGCSEKTVRYYDSTIRNVITVIGKEIKHVTTDDLRLYLDDYQSKSNVSKVTIDNIRRILSSFFSWLEDEDYIPKSPVRRIHKVKTCKTVKETYTDEALELMRDNSECIRDLAIIDLLASTGMRVGELVKLNRSDIDFEGRECVVLGKGNKQRKVYFDARAKIHIQHYLNTRIDDNEALFVSLQKPYDRLQISGVEIRLREIGRIMNINRVNPHKFLLTLATVSIDKSLCLVSWIQLQRGGRKNR